MTQDELEFPPKAFFETEFEFQTVKSGSRYLRLFNKRYPNPLGCGIGISRFGDAEGHFCVVYATVDIFTSFTEAVHREDHRTQKNIFHYSPQILSAYMVADLYVSEDMKLVDMTENMCYQQGIPTDVVKASNHHQSMPWSTAFYKHPQDFDGIIYNSRFTGAINIVVYERSLIKFDQHPQTKPLTAFYNTIKKAAQSHSRVMSFK